MNRKIVLSTAIFLICFTWVLSAIPTSANILYVTPGGTGSGKYLWFNAAGSIQTAINNASSGDEIWVAEGTYSASFAVPEGIMVFGGFSGDEDYRDDRDWKFNLTILSGAAISATGTSSAPSAIDGFRIINITSVTTETPAISLVGDVTFSHNIVTGCENGKDGGGNVIFGSGPVKMVNNLIYSNILEDGMIISLGSQQGDAVFVNNTVSGNGGACIPAVSVNGIITNNIITGGAGGSCGISGVDDAYGTPYNCVWGNSCGNYVNTPPG